MKRLLFLTLGGRRTASSRLICYENAKYLEQLGWEVAINAPDIEKFDIVIFQKRFARCDLPLVKRVKGKVVLQISEAYYLKNPGWAQNILKLAKSSHAIIVGSKPIHQWFHSFRKRSIIIPTGLDFAALPKGKKQLPMKICWIGTAGNEKYLEIVVGSLNELWRKYNFEFRIIGTKMPHLRFKRKPNFIRWQLGKAERQVSECHIGIAPLFNKAYEGAKPPSKPVLYMAQGLAVVATETIPYRTVITDKVNGFLIRGNDPARWTRALRALLTDEKRRASFIARGKIACQKFDAPQIAKLWDAALRNL